MSNQNKTKEIIEATTALTKAIPIYQDLLQPAAIEVGKGLETVAKTVNVALAPLSSLVWGYEQIRLWLESRLTHELKDSPSNEVITPNPHVVCPAIEALRYASGDENLREMFAKLIATAMKIDDAEKAHPTFVEILKQLSPDEAKIIPHFLSNTYHPFISIDIEIPNLGTRACLSHWTRLALDAKCSLPGYVSAYMENLKRLGIIEFDENAEIEPEHYDELLIIESIKDIIDSLKDSEPNGEVIIRKGVVTRTMLGQMFMDACIGETSGTQAKPIHI